MKYRFQDNTLPFEERAKDLLSRLTREEKVGMITSQLDDIPRLGIKKTHIGTEIARGVVNRDQKRETTILPQPWGMAAMFDDALMEQLGDMAGDETRITHDMEERPSSLELFGPTIDMEHDPRWGRNEEAYGEDPCLTGKMSAAYCRGLTGKDEKYLKTAPLLKHFYANNYENERQTTNANITPRLKHEYYLKAFEPAVREGRAPGLMTAYNCINGVEGVNNPDVSEICKKEWGMTFAVSDGGDFGQNVAAHRTYENHAQSMGDILGVGADMMLDSRSMVDPAVREALEKGYLTEENLDKAVYSTLLLRFKLGDFDEDHPYAHIDPAKLASPAHKALAVKAAKESVILLENRGMLPLTDDGKCTVAVVGPLANENYTCWYCGYAPNQTPVVKGFREKLGEDRVLFDEGFDRVRIRSEKTGKYLRIAENGAVYADADENTADLFERADWDFGAWTLRSVRTGKYLTEDKNFFDETPQDENAVTIDPGMNCTADVVFGWFVKELLYAKEEDGVLYLDTWQHRAVAVNDENKLVAKPAPVTAPASSLHWKSFPPAQSVWQSSRNAPTTSSSARVTSRSSTRARSMTVRISACRKPRPRFWTPQQLQMRVLCCTSSRAIRSPSTRRRTPPKPCCAPRTSVRASAMLLLRPSSVKTIPPAAPRPRGIVLFVISPRLTITTSRKTM